MQHLADFVSGIKKLSLCIAVGIFWNPQQGLPPSEWYGVSDILFAEFR